VNLTHQSLQRTKSIQFSYDNEDHIELLEKLWKGLKPEIIRSEDRLSDEWGELGFQGKDPSTDFRGMGLLSLIQLVYFADNYPVEARALLELSSSPENAYFPFAAVAINFTCFILQLLEEHRLHCHLFKQEDLASLYEENDVDDIDSFTVQRYVENVHNLYCKIYLRFGELWKERNPRDIMDFPALFAELKATIREEFPAL
jgi:hypothetical protein